MRPAHLKQRRAKEVRRILKRRNAIRNERIALGYAKLEKPVRHGWYKEFVLTANLDRYKSQPEIEEVFDKIVRSYWGRNKKECDKRWNAETSKHFIVRDMPTISKKQFCKLSDKAKQLCTPYLYRECRKMKTRYYIRIPKPAYKIKYTRAYVTHTKLIDPVLEQEDALLEQHLEKPGYYNFQCRSWGDWRDRWSTPETKKDRLRSKKALREYRT